MHTTFDGTWHNQHGSELHLTIDEEGVIRGRFCSAVGFARGEEALVTGFATGEIVSLVARFAPHECLTVWIGHHRVQDGLESIETLWHMAGTSADAPAGKDAWRSVWSGADVFHRGPAGTRPGSGHGTAHATGYRGGRPLHRPG